MLMLYSEEMNIKKRKRMPNNIRAFRDERNLTQQQLADLMGDGITANSISRIERGDPTMPLSEDWLIRFAEVFDKDPVDIISNIISTRIRVEWFIGVNAEIIKYSGDGIREFISMPAMRKPVEADKIEAAKITEGSFSEFTGWYVLFGKSPQGVDKSCIDSDFCILKIRNGPILIRKLLLGTQNGCYHIISSNGSVQSDQEIEWATPILSICP